MSEEILSTSTCQNCGVRVAQNYCPNCGQEHTSLIVPIGQLFRDVLDEFIVPDSKLLATIKLLLTRPGFLTNEYIAGRRMRYVGPFRLYFVISATYFLAFSIAHYDVAVMHGLSYALERTHPAHVSESHSTSQRSVSNVPDDMHIHKHYASPSESSDRARRHHLAVDRTSSWFLKNQSLITFLLVPIAALFLKLLFQRSRRLYIEHLVFAVHVQSFMFALLLPALLPYYRNITYIMAISLSAIYLFAAMRTVYRHNAAVTLATSGLMLTAYLGMMSIAADIAFITFYALA